MRKRSISLARALGFAIAAPIGAGLVAFASTSLSACGVGDQYCPDDTIDTDLNDDCPYGPPGGPQESGASCPSVVFLDPAADPTCADATFESAYAIFTGPTGSCTLGACHGTTQAAASANGVELHEDDAAQFYTELSKYKNAAGEPYLGENVPRSWILCNLKAQVGGGSPMPTSFPPLTQAPDDLAVVEEWVLCGMKPPGSGGPTTASTSTGEGGEGGGGTGGDAGGGGTGGAGEGGLGVGGAGGAGGG